MRALGVEPEQQRPDRGLVDAHRLHHGGQHVLARASRRSVPGHPRAPAVLVRTPDTPALALTTAVPCRHRDRAASASPRASRSRGGSAAAFHAGRATGAGSTRHRPRRSRFPVPPSHVSPGETADRPPRRGSAARAPPPPRLRARWTRSSSMPPSPENPREFRGSGSGDPPAGSVSTQATAPGSRVRRPVGRQPAREADERLGTARAGREERCRRGGRAPGAPRGHRLGPIDRPGVRAGALDEALGLDWAELEQRPPRRPPPGPRRSPSPSDRGAAPGAR